jgi:hypothetical protein
MLSLKFLRNHTSCNIDLKTDKMKKRKSERKKEREREREIEKDSE